MRKFMLLVAAMFAADSLLYVGLRALDSSRIFYDRSAVTPERLRHWLSSTYDPELGWDIGAGSKNNVGASRHGNYPAADHYKLKAFGDSFVFGSDVTDHQTWPAIIEKQTGWMCLNYGVPGYGPDQAFLKYRRTPVKTEWTILGIQQENIARLVNIYRAFYMEDWGPPKPRFFLDGSDLRLEPNPIGRPEDAGRLLDPVFVDRLRRLDYWPHYNEAVLGAPRRLQWPATWTVLRHARFFLSRGLLEVRLRLHPTYNEEAQRFKPYHLYQDSSEAFETLSRLIDRFVTLCSDRGERPLIVIFPMQHSVELMRTYGRCVYEPLARRLHDRAIPLIDLGPIFAREDFARYYLLYNGHFSAEGNERVALEVVAYVEKN